MPTFVSSKRNMRVLEEMCSKNIGKGVIFFVECEDGAIRSACSSQSYALQYRKTYCPSMCICGDNVRVSATSAHFFSPSPNRNNSNL